MRDKINVEYTKAMFPEKMIRFSKNFMKDVGHK